VFVRFRRACKRKKRLSSSVVALWRPCPGRQVFWNRLQSLHMTDCLTPSCSATYYCVLFFSRRVTARETSTDVSCLRPSPSLRSISSERFRNSENEITRFTIITLFLQRNDSNWTFFKSGFFDNLSFPD
jgi:hypothetical protein